MTYDQLPRSLPDIDAVVWIGRMADDPLVLFVERIHRSPGERNASLKFARVVRQSRVLPCGALCNPLASAHREPGARPEVGVLACTLRWFQGVRHDVGFPKIGHGISARFKQKHYVFSIGDPGTAEVHAHSPPHRFDVQQPRA
ncbi:hypothetical protein PQQ64_20400 [Paraburkholderia graminis]